MNRHHIPSHCLAPVSEWMTWAQAGEVVVCEGERFEKSGYSNRYRIATANGPLLLTIPIVGGRGTKLPMHQVSICYQHDWRRQHTASWKAAYGRSAFFLHFGDLLLSVLCSGEKSLSVLNRALLLQCAGLLGLELSFTFSLQPLPLESKAMRADPRPYRQVFADRYGFLPGMSIIDLLFNEGPEGAWLLRQG
ncbi:MAG: WbqC family protein [Chitinophagales bacterium]|nr:WbqC family protein [Chitinophagales bacterium]MDW8392766.1 WbqC family protein [Chitinophagales bacterium]